MTITSTRLLSQAKALVKDGYAIEGLDVFEQAVEEAQCMVDNAKLEEEMLPIETLFAQATLHNPDPSRYGE